MSKKLSAILAVLMVALFAFFAIASSSDGEKTEQDAGKADAQNADSNVGEYSVDIKSARLSESWDGKDVVVITYGFTNNSDDSASFGVAFEDNAYQNGVGLERAYTLKDGDPYDDGNQYKDIKTGATLDVEVPYVLNDTETDVEVEVEELFGLNDDMVTRTFSIK
ncbi:MAG: DUF5067 domain-containing protein [Clostridia bacterium]|mgnify:CR=1 FL=1|nr:DUF5067 domain-containing protein [Clostridia bacterium]